MKKIPLIFVLLVAHLAYSQAVRVDPIPSSTTNGLLPGGQYPPLLVVPGTIVTLCGYPANGFPCTNFAASYTNAAMGTACTSGNPVVLNGSQNCQSTTDNQGKFGFWVTSGNYTYMLRNPQTNQLTGPFFFSAGGSGGGGSAAFSAITPGTNTLGSMIVGTGSSLSVSGSGTIVATSAPYSGLTGSVPTWNQNTTGNAATATVAASVPYSGLTGTVPTWNQNTTGNAATATLAAKATAAATVGNACPPGQAPTGVDANWNAVGCAPISGIQSINGDTTSAQVLAASGSGLTVATAAGTTTYTLAGGGLTGSITSGGGLNDVAYPAGAAGTIVGPASNSLTEPLSRTTAQLNTDFGTANIRIHIQAGDADTPFANTHANRVVDDRTDHPAFTYSLKDFGAQANLHTISGSLSGTTLTSTGLTAALIGQSLVGICTPVGGVQTVFEGHITAVGSSTSATTTGNPGSVCAISSGSNNMEIGQDDTAALATAIGLQTAGNPGAKVVLTVPVGNTLTHTITAIPYSLTGLSPVQSAIVGFPCESVFNVSGGNLQDIGNFTLRPDDRCDATKPWQYVDPTGTLNSVSAAYNPLAAGTPYSNNPTSPAWCQGPGANFSGCTVGAYSTTATSASMTLLTAAVPVAGQQIVCPFTSGGVLNTTISSVTGTTVVLATAYPDTTAQAECFAGTSFQNIQTAIPATGRTFPITLTVANSLASSPATAWNVGGVGVLKIGTEHFFYDSITRSVAGTNSFKLENSIENGTGATGPAHSVNDVVVPVNPFLLDSAEWAIGPSINTNTTPPGAEPYPAFNVGTFGYGVSQADGTVGSAAGPFGSWFHKLIIEQWPVANTSPSNENNVADFYFVASPYGTRFEDNFMDGNYCYVQGGPGFNNYAASGSDGDATQFNNNTCRGTSHGAAVMITSGNQISATNWDIYGGGGVVGGQNVPSGPGFNITGGVNDRTALYGSGVSDSVFSNIYVEPGGSAYGNAANAVISATTSIFNDMHYSGGGDYVITGAREQFKGGDIGNFAMFPVIVYGGQDSFDRVFTFATKGPSVYGSTPFLNYSAQNTGCLIGGTSISGEAFSCQPRVAGFVTPPVGQTADTFAAGNVLNPFENPTESLFPADHFNRSSGLAGVWTFDNTIPWITNGYQPCALPAPPTSNGCSVNFSLIGAGQRVVAGKTNIFFGAKQQSGSSQSLKFSIGAASGGSCSGGTIQTWNIPLSTTWTVYNPGVVDLSAYAGCTLTAGFNDSNSNTAAIQLQTAFLSAQPVAENITASQFTTSLSGTPACISSGSGAPSGAPTQPNGNACAVGSTYSNTSGSLGSLLYVWTGSTWSNYK